jgi:hypothetical protein
MKTTLSGGLALLLSCAGPASAQNDAASTPAGTVAPAAQAAAATAPASPDQNAVSRSMIIDEIVDSAVKSTKVWNIREPFAQSIAGSALGEIVSYLIAVRAERQGYRALLDAMEARVDKQVGSTPGSSGSTSLIMKGLVPEILGVAVENGALNEDQKGTTVTFRATPAGIVKALQGQGLLGMYSDYSQSLAWRAASRFSAAASFDTSRGPEAGTFTGSGQQLSAWSARYVIVNHRDPASSQYAGFWTDLSRQSPAYLNASDTITSALNKPVTPFADWNAALVARVRRDVDVPWTGNHDTAAAAATFKGILQEQLALLEKLPEMPADITKALDDYVAQLTAVQTGIDSVYAFAGKGALVTFDWSTTRDLNLPDLYTATAIWEAGLGISRKTDLTVNGALSFYRTVPLTARHQLKSLDVTMQLEHPLGSLWTLPSVTVSLAGRYSFLPSDTVASTTMAAAGSAPALQGNIGVFQAKLTIPVKGGVKIPLSITASNRTELIKEKDVRASFGVTYDLDPLLGGLLTK